MPTTLSATVAKKPSVKSAYAKVVAPTETSRGRAVERMTTTIASAMARGKVRAGFFTVVLVLLLFESKMDRLASSITGV